MRVIPVFLRVVACPLLSALVIFSAATGASAQQSGAPQKPTVIKPDASDKNAAAQSKLVFRKAWAGHKAPELPESKLVFRSENKHGNPSEDYQNATRYPGDLSYPAASICFPGEAVRRPAAGAIRKASCMPLARASLCT